MALLNPKYSAEYIFN